MWQQLTSVSNVSVKLKILAQPLRALQLFLVFYPYADLISPKYIDKIKDQMCAVVEVKRGKHSVQTL
tara:strand:+ start:139 stop:339 length:201 start_codon:yes stop_codon:yes gene_type:complete